MATTTDGAEPSKATADSQTLPQPAETKHCGIIMPISDTDGYDTGHWLEVRSLIVRAAQQAGYTAGMVSENDGQDVIHRSIVKNIYHNELVVCDVSSLNPNVMLELGLRMANKKPLVIVFDGEGIYPFDIKSMLYIPYPKGLRHSKVENFVQELTTRIKQVGEADKAGKYEPFLNQFNDVVIEVSELDKTTRTFAETLTKVVNDLSDIRTDLQGFKSDNLSAIDNANNPPKFINSRERQLIDQITTKLYKEMPSYITRPEAEQLILDKVRSEYFIIHPSLSPTLLLDRFMKFKPSIIYAINKRLDSLSAA